MYVRMYVRRQTAIVYNETEHIMGIQGIQMVIYVVIINT